MIIINTSIKVWSRAKAMVNLIADRSVMTKFLIDTLEAKEPISPNTMFCIGESGDAWQQHPDKLLKKYNITDIDEDGWMVCQPKPENEVHFFELTPTQYSTAYGEEMVIRGLFGETIGEHTNLQRCIVGDFVCRNPQDHNDQWVVKRKLFLNSYSILNA